MALLSLWNEPVKQSIAPLSTLNQEPHEMAGHSKWAKVKQFGEDHVMEAALEAGAEDFKSEPEGYEILTDPGHFEAVLKQLESRGIKAVVAEIAFLPAVTVPMNEAAAVAVNKLIDALEENDDVKEVHSNAEFPD